jgi:hypothetical protein
MVVGTNRPGSNTRKIASQIEEIYRELNTPLKVLDLANLPQEIFNPSSYAEKPVSFKPFSEGILQSSGLGVGTRVENLLRQVRQVEDLERRVQLPVDFLDLRRDLARVAPRPVGSNDHCYHARENGGTSGQRQAFGANAPSGPNNAANHWLTPCRAHVSKLQRCGGNFFYASADFQSTFPPLNLWT